VLVSVDWTGASSVQYFLRLGVCTCTTEVLELRDGHRAVALGDTAIVTLLSLVVQLPGRRDSSLEGLASQDSSRKSSSSVSASSSDHGQVADGV